jgi:hypothetical protein
MPSPLFLVGLMRPESWRSNFLYSLPSFSTQLQLALDLISGLISLACENHRFRVEDGVTGFLEKHPSITYTKLDTYRRYPYRCLSNLRELIAWPSVPSRPIRSLIINTNHSLPTLSDSVLTLRPPIITVSSISDSRFLSDSQSLPFLIYDLLRVPFLFHDLFLGLSRTVHVSLLFPDSVTAATAFR